MLHILSRPESMPSDKYFGKFEQSVYASQALFWARSYIWQFQDLKICQYKIWEIIEKM